MRLCSIDLGRRHNACIVVDATKKEVDQQSAFEECNWKTMYGNVAKAILLNAPEPRGKDVDL